PCQASLSLLGSLLVRATYARGQDCTQENKLLLLRAATDTPRTLKVGGCSGHPGSHRRESPNRRCPRQWMILAAFSSRSSTNPQGVHLWVRSLRLFSTRAPPHTR